MRQALAAETPLGVRVQRNLFEALTPQDNPMVTEANPPALAPAA